jgi:aryl-alcohol dehydrogenase-like predicted oxidoreductase
LSRSKRAACSGSATSTTGEQEREDRIDLYLAHFDDGVTPIEEIMRGFDDIVRAGKVLYVGLSNFSAWRSASAAMLAELRGWSLLAVLQLQYNLLQRELDREHLPFARARGMGVMAYSPLASGRLWRPAGGQAAADRDAAILDVVVRVADELQTTSAAVSLAWVCAKGLVPVIGPRSAEQLGGNLAGAELELSSEQIARLDVASKQPHGHPYELLEGTRERVGLASARSGLVI